MTLNTLKTIILFGWRSSGLQRAFCDSCAIVSPRPAIHLLAWDRAGVFRDALAKIKALGPVFLRACGNSRVASRVPSEVTIHQPSTTITGEAAALGEASALAEASVWAWDEE
jgi:hypothetical protein